jgi:hypothetical protein
MSLKEQVFIMFCPLSVYVCPGLQNSGFPKIPVGGFPESKGKSGILRSGFLENQGIY